MLLYVERCYVKSNIQWSLKLLLGLGPNIDSCLIWMNFDVRCAFCDHCGQKPYLNTLTVFPAPLIYLNAPLLKYTVLKYNMSCVVQTNYTYESILFCKPKIRMNRFRAVRHACWIAGYSFRPVSLHDTPRMLGFIVLKACKTFFFCFNYKLKSVARIILNCFRCVMSVLLKSYLIIWQQVSEGSKCRKKYFSFYSKITKRIDKESELLKESNQNQNPCWKCLI